MSAINGLSPRHTWSDQNSRTLAAGLDILEEEHLLTPENRNVLSG